MGTSAGYASDGRVHKVGLRVAVNRSYLVAERFQADVVGRGDFEHEPIVTKSDVLRGLKSPVRSWWLASLAQADSAYPGAVDPGASAEAGARSSNA